MTSNYGIGKPITEYVAELKKENKRLKRALLDITIELANAKDKLLLLGETNEA
jgi:hypothetical protein